MATLPDGRVLVAELNGNRASVIPAGGGVSTTFASLPSPYAFTLSNGRILVAQIFQARVGVITEAEAGVAYEFNDAFALPDRPLQDVSGFGLINGDFVAPETADCYTIDILDVDAFSATTVLAATESTVDTDLILFSSGFENTQSPIVANDDASGTEIRSTIPVGALSGRGLSPGFYSLCVTLSGNAPVNAAGEPLIAVGGDRTAVRIPSAPNGDFVVASFPEATVTDRLSYRVQLTGVDASVSTDERPVSESVSMALPSPNPVTDGARIGYAFSDVADVEVTVSDLLGRRVLVLDSGRKIAGDHEATFDARRLAPGVYVVRIRAGASVTARTITVVR